MAAEVQELDVGGGGQATGASRQRSHSVGNARVARRLQPQSLPDGGVVGRHPGERGMC